MTPSLKAQHFMSLSVKIIQFRHISNNLSQIDSDCIKMIKIPKRHTLHDFIYLLRLQNVLISRNSQIKLLLCVFVTSESKNTVNL